VENNEEKVAGTNLTVVPEYNDTALALRELQTRHKGVVYEVSQPKQMKLAKEARAEVKKYRTDLEKKRVEIKAPALERCRLIDAEAKRITGELLALEEPIDIQIKAEEARVEAERLRVLEEQQRRVDGIKASIQAFRDAPSKVIGRPSAGIESALSKLMDVVVTEEDFAEFFLEAKDAHTAALATLAQMVEQQRNAEAEAERVRAQEAELSTLREHAAKLEREAEERRKEDEQREREKAQQIELVEAQRVQRIRDKIHQISFVPPIANWSVERIDAHNKEWLRSDPREGQFDYEEFQDEACKAFDAAHEHLIEIRKEAVRKEREAYEANERRLENERIAEENRKERERLAALEKEQAEKAEALRLNSLDFESAAMAMYQWAMNSGHSTVQQVYDFGQVISRRGNQNEALTAKRQAAPATRKPRTQA
jgi:ribosomal protein S25